MPMHVQLQFFDPRWIIEFEIESRRIVRALGANVLAVHHIGSTAIPTVYAKPIIDLLVVVRTLRSVDDQSAAMEQLGYEALGEYGIPGRRYFRKDDLAGNRTHHVHTFAQGSPEINRHLVFRDFLRADTEWAQKYSDLKRALAQAHPDSIERYMDGKGPFIKEAERAAAAWQAGGWEGRPHAVAGTR